MEWKVAGLIARPFDILFAIYFSIFILQTLTNARPVSLAFARNSEVLFYVSFVFISVLTATFLGWKNFLREGLQSVELLFFFLLLGLQPIDFRKLRHFAVVLLGGVLLVMLFTISWYFSHGIYFGFKRLGEAKIAFSLTPVVIALLIRPESFWRIGVLMSWTLLFVIVG